MGSQQARLDFAYAYTNNP